MAKRPSNLPDFGAPPVTEVVLSLQFAELKNYRTVHAGLLWDRHFRKRYPRVLEQPSLEPVFELFGPRAAENTGFQITAMPGPPVPRLWFIDNDNTELIQFQADRFIHNWRKTEIDQKYPRYETIREKFESELQLLQHFLREENIGLIEPNQWEITYINYIRLGAGEDARTDVDKIFRFWSSERSTIPDPGATLPELEEIRLFSRYRINDQEGKPVGRLIVSTQPGIDQNNIPIMRLDLTARGAPNVSTIDDSLRCLDIGREVIVRGFTAITEPNMHEIWKRKK